MYRAIVLLFLVCQTRLLVATLFARLMNSNIVDIQQYEKDGKPNDPGLATYVSRPDIFSPRWSITVHDKTLLTPGYWFVAPYRGINGEQSSEPFVGPFIYNASDGELIWSGGHLFRTAHANVEDFRLSDVNGESVPTMLAQNQVVVLNDDYTIRTGKMVEMQGRMNTHELHFVDNGSRAIVLINDVRIVFPEALPEDAGVEKDERKCTARFDGFAELDVTQDHWPRIMEWRSFGKISLKESSFISGSVKLGCFNWDFLHANSVDKTPEGDYLLSARHTDSIYKISGLTGDIIWRLGGRKSDFTIFDQAIFSRQHHVRYRGRNDTHTLISILDNGKGQDEQPSTNDFSRGLLLALDETNMRATVERQFKHPYHANKALTPRRGNFQQLPNGNVLMGWSERALMSEHTPDGKLIWDAIMQVDWMGSYRNYKFEDFVGRPSEPPIGVARASTDSSGTYTTVFLSWNGATEVASWRLYKTSPDGKAVHVHVATAAKTSFETAVQVVGFAQHVVAEAVGRDGRSLGNTTVITTSAAESVSAEAVAAEEAWILHALDEQRARSRAKPSAMAPAFCAGAVFAAIVMLALRHSKPRGVGMLRHRLFNSPRYTAIPQ